MVWVALSLCGKWEHVDRSLPNEDTKFQYCMIKHRVASKYFHTCIFCQSSWKHIVRNGRRSSFVLKMNWQLQKCSKCCKKTYGNECLSRTNIFEWYGKFRSARECVDGDTRAGRPEPVEHRNTSQKYTLLWQTINVQRSKCWPNSSTLIKKPFVKLSQKIKGKKVVCAIYSPLRWYQNNGKIT